VSQAVGISTVTVTYSRPSVNKRTVWGELVPYGWNVQPGGTNNPAPWRAGANENTTIEFSHPAKFEGQAVPAGKYGMFMTINQDNSGEVILSKDNSSWGNFFYNPSHDFLRVKIQTREVPYTEMLTYEFINNAKNSTELTLNWEKKQFPVKIEFAVDDIVMANAEAELRSAKGFNWQSYNGAANYALNNNVNLDKAMEWVDQSLNRGGNNFATNNIKARLLTKAGKKEEGDKLMAEAVKTANEGELNTYGYQLLNLGETDKAIEMLALNTQHFPKSANTWDSLGEAYATKGDKKNAITNFKKSLTLNPAPGVKANSEKFLKQLGAM
jgi:tetratricopeptide (TPR) repeat protein